MATALAATEKNSTALYCGDCLEVLAGMRENSVDYVLTDPPYGLTSGPNAKGGFMGKEWDRGVPGPAYWEAVLRVCKPGAMMTAFGGTRTWHRLACAIEDAGWEIRDTLLWAYGQGFPKGHDISKALDKAAGAEREIVASRKLQGKARVLKGGNYGGDYTNRDATDEYNITAPATDLARLWNGWNVALKPAWEPILLAMKPLDGTYAENAEQWGVAGMHVDGGRIGTNGEMLNQGAGKPGYADFDDNNYKWPGGSNPQHPKGRWPANLLLTHHPECVCRGVKKVKAGPWGMGKSASKTISGIHASDARQIDNAQFRNLDGTETVENWDCHPDCPVRLLDEQSGEKIHGAGYQTSGKHCVGTGPKDTATYKLNYEGAPMPRYGDSGGASRFFYTGKASTREREAGLIGHIPCAKCGGLDTTHHIDERGNRVPCRRNVHPTVKPVSLMRYLLKLLATPTGGVILDPFMGSGSAGVACAEEGRDFIGIDIGAENVEVARWRIEHAKAERGMF